VGAEELLDARPSVAQDRAEGHRPYAVLGADGRPIALTDSRNAAIANAIENDLVPVSVH
jgi:hypothetical protein